MVYKAKIHIGDFAPGDIVPDETAIIWSKMYKESPVELVFDAIQEKVEEKKLIEVPEAEMIEKAYEDKLLKVNGIGKKTVKDILSKYPTEKSLTDALKNEEHLPFRDDVANILMKIFIKGKR